MKMGMVDASAPEPDNRLQGLWRIRDARDLETYLKSSGVADWFVGGTVLLFAQSAKLNGKGKAVDVEASPAAEDSAL